MKAQRTLTLLTFNSAVALLFFGLVGCSNSPKTQTTAAESPSTQDVAQDSPSMNHDGMNHDGMNHDGTSMPGMDHGAMSMDLGPKDEAFDLRLIDAMIPHHEGAVAMAQEALEKSTRPEIQQLAQAIIEAQEQEIAQMKEWRAAWYPDADETPMMYDASMGHMMPMTDEMRRSMMMFGDLGDADDQFDLRFIDAMIPHHEGAIDMAQQALEKSDRPEIQQLAQNILSSQQQEIDQMTQWRQQWYNQ